MHLDAYKEKEFLVYLFLFVRDIDLNFPKVRIICHLNNKIAFENIQITRLWKTMRYGKSIYQEKYSENKSDKWKEVWCFADQYVWERY